MTSRQYESLPRHKARQRQAARQRDHAKRRRQQSESGGNLRLWALAALLFAGAFWIVAQNIDTGRAPVSAAPVVGGTPFYLPATANPAVAMLSTPIPPTIDISPRVTMRAGSGMSAPAGSFNAPLVGGEPTAIPAPGVTPLAGNNSVALINLPRPILPTPIPVSAGVQLGAFCNFNALVSINIYDWETGATTLLSSEWIAALPLTWDASQSIWRGYAAAKPFDEPDDLRILWRVSLFGTDGVEQFLDVGRGGASPALYVYAFDNTTPYADSNGRYFGMHPCRAFTMAQSNLDYLISAAQAYQEFNGSYPDLITPDDARWTRGMIQPIESILNLRAIPMQYNNEPIFQITQPMEAWYAVDGRNWGEWAQIKIGNVQGWVNTGYVRFGAS
ncbi:MAG: hypothetical protein SGI73_11080 [Chloroflexota bacterium]|nr:hypothetical protein [Chloroflexota bacterium]